MSDRGLLGKYNSVGRAPLVRLLVGDVLALAAFLGLVVATPFALFKMVPAGYEWGELSEVTQVYGSVSILISSVALAGVVRCSVFQLVRRGPATSKR